MSKLPDSLDSRRIFYPRGRDGPRDHVLFHRPDTVEGWSAVEKG